MTRYNIKEQKEDVISKAIFNSSKIKKIDEDYWKNQDKILKEIFK